jgi:DNA-directed RNA polymerase specialized sigma24 family protein
VKIDSLRDPSRFGPWLCGIAVNITRRWLRAASREYTAGADVEPGPEHVVVECEVAALIRSALKELPDGQRAAVWLFYLRNYSCPRSAARRRMPASYC